jgi:hypothetical protein
MHPIDAQQQNVLISAAILRRRNQRQPDGHRQAKRSQP